MSELPAEQEVTLGGMLTQVRFMNTKKARNGNSRYVRCKLEDFTGAAECVMWPDDFVRYKDELPEDHVCFVKRHVERNREEPGLVLTRILTSGAGPPGDGQGAVALLLAGPRAGRRGPAGPDPGRRPAACPVYLTIRDGANKSAVLRLGRDYGVNPAAYEHDALEALLGEGHVKLL